MSSTDDRPPLAVHLKPRKRTRLQAASAVAERSSSRAIHTPYGSRDDVGPFGVYQGNWGGRRRAVALRHHIIEDIVQKCPAHILCAQEVDKEFIRVLQDSWHVVYGKEGTKDKTCIVAVKASVAAEVQLVEWRKIPDGRYKDKKKNGIRQSREFLWPALCGKGLCMDKQPRLWRRRTCTARQPRKPEV